MPRNFSRGAYRLVIGHALLPAFAGQRLRRRKHGIDQCRHLGIVEHEILEAALQAACAARPATFGTQQPAPQIRHLLAREMGRERAIGGAEEMMALVEHIACRQALIFMAPPIAAWIITSA